MTSSPTTLLLVSHSSHSAPLSVSQMCWGAATVSSAYNPFPWTSTVSSAYNPFPWTSTSTEMREIMEDLLCHIKESQIKTLGSQTWPCFLFSKASVVGGCVWDYQCGCDVWKGGEHCQGGQLEQCLSGWISFWCSQLTLWLWHGGWDHALVHKKCPTVSSSRWLP